MSRPAFLANHNLIDYIVIGVHRLEPIIQFPRCRELKLDRATDEEILEYAATHHFIVVSHDVNTMSAAAHARMDEDEHLAGLFLIHQDHELMPVIDDLVMIGIGSDAEEWINQNRFVPL